MFISFLLCGALSAQTGARFGLKAGFNLATQYVKPADDCTQSAQRKEWLCRRNNDILPYNRVVGIQQELLYVMKGSGQDVTITTL